MGVFQEQARDKSDWTDQDLLTLDEAEERLLEQVADVSQEIDAVGPERAAELQKRLAAVNERLEFVRGRRSRLTDQS